jgi:putative ABC transport system permease protein
MVHELWSDIKHALRLLRRSPRNTAIAIVILGLGIGTNTAMFSAMENVLVRQLPLRLSVVLQDPVRALRTE